MKGEKKEIKNKKQLYLLALCGVLAVSGAVYAGTRKSEPEKPGKELVDLNEPGDQSLPGQDGQGSGVQASIPSPTAGAAPGPSGQPGPTSVPSGGNIADSGKDQPHESSLNESSDSTGQSGKPVIGQGAGAVAGQGGGTASGQDGKTASGQDDKTASGQDGKTASGQNGKTASGQDGKTDSGQDGKTASGQDGEEPEQEPAEAANSPTVGELKFSAEEGLYWPLSGNVVKSYSADRMVYFDTLQQFRTNPAIFIAGEPGADIVSAADGIILAVGKEDKLGQTLTMEIGDGYRLVYGQLADVKVSEGDYVTAGSVLAKLAPVTKYYRLEGNHLYFQVQKDESTVNPLTLIRQSEE